MTTECPTCGRDDFKSEQGMKQHHALSHGESISGVKTECKNCNETYRVRKANVERSSFCSTDCQTEYMFCGEIENHPRSVEEVSLTCENCGKVFFVIPSRSDRKYCSRSCSGEAKSKVTGEDHPLYQQKTNQKCKYCGSTYSVPENRLDETNFCSKSCIHKWMSERKGPEHPLYEGGEHNLYKQRDWRVFSRKYRNWVGKCESCGSTENLQTHHDEPLSMGGDLYDNTFTVLCTQCHYGNYDKWHPSQLEEYIDQNS